MRSRALDDDSEVRLRLQLLWVAFIWELRPSSAFSLSFASTLLVGQGLYPCLLLKMAMLQTSCPTSLRERFQLNERTSLTPKSYFPKSPALIRGYNRRVFM